MSMIVPVLLIGAMATAAWALDTTPPGTSTPSRHLSQPVSTTEALGIGAYLKGAVADLGGTPTDALQGYLGALADDPENMELRQRSFELSLMSADVPNAIRLARTLPEMEQTTISRLVLLAAAAREGHQPEARKHAREVAKVADLLQFRLLQAYLNYAKGERVPTLVEWLETIPAPGSLAGRRHYHEARLLLKDGQPARALELLRQAHKEEPSAVTSTLLLGQILALQGQPDAAAVVYDSFRAENPALALLVPPGSTLLNTKPEPFTSTLEEDLSATLADFGLLVWSQGAISPARQVLNLSLWLNPEDIYTRYYSALLLEMGGDLPAAKAEYTRLLASNIHPGFRLAVEIRLAEVQFREGDEVTPLKTLRDLAAKNPTVIPLQRSLAQIAFTDVGRTAGVAATIAILFIVIIALAGLGKVVVKALGGEEVKYPAGSVLRFDAPTMPDATVVPGGFK